MDGPLGGDGDQDACVTYRKAKKKEVGRERRDGAPKVSGDKVKRGGQILNGPNLRAGLRNRCYRRDSEFRCCNVFGWALTSPPRVNGVLCRYC